PLPARLRAARALRVPDLRVVPRGVHPRQRALSLPRPRVAGGDAALPSLAPRRCSRGGRSELRRPPAAHRPSLRHRLLSRRPLAGVLRLGRPTGAERLAPPAGVAASPVSEPRRLIGGTDFGEGAARRPGRVVSDIGGPRAAPDGARAS